MATLAAPVSPLPEPTYAEVNRDIVATLAPPTRTWLLGMGLVVLGVLCAAATALAPMAIQVAAFMARKSARGARDSE